MSTVRYTFHVKRSGGGAPKRLQPGTASAPPPEKVPRVARLLALAHKFQGMRDRGEVESMAELARLGRVSRACVTQIMDLLLLAPEIQEAIRFGGVDVALRQLLGMVREIAWDHQRAWLARNLFGSIAA